MMTKNNHSTGVRQGIWAAFLLAVAFTMAQPAKAQTQWVTNGNNINNTNSGNVGIGTPTPNTNLHVLLTPTTNVITKQTNLNGFLLLSGWGDVNAKTGFVGSFATVPGISSGVILGREGLSWGTYVAFHTHGDHANTLDELAERMRISANGNVGIGTTIPNYRLDIQGGQINTSGGLCMAGDCKTSWSQVTGSSQWTTSNPNIFYNSGNVGVGTTAPSSKLHVVGDVTLTGTGNLSASGTITAGNIVAKYQDIAEWVPARQAMPAGTVVVLDTDQFHHVLASSQSYDTRVAGVVSERPGLILGESGNGKVLVATTGRVRVKVDATRAPIRAGDILVTSDRQGIAMRSEPINLGGAKIHRPGTIIGKALEPLDKGIGEILVLLSLQ